MNNEERQYTIRQLGDNPTQADIARAAAALVQYRAEQEVRRVANDIISAAGSYERTKRLYWYPLLSPKPAPVKVRDAEGVEMWQQPQRQQYKVRLSDLPAFCKENGLDLKAMTEVGEGIRKEHKGWLRAPFQGGQFEMGKTYEEPRKAKIKLPTLPVKQMQVLFAEPPITYKPTTGDKR